MTNTVSGVVSGSLLLARDVHAVNFVLPAPRSAPVPRQLPPAESRFVDRDVERERLDAAFAGTRPTGAACLVVIDGPYGVGKSAVAVRWAHDRVDQFGDGQLYGDFGTGPSARPSVAVEDVLGSFLLSLGVPREELEPDLAGRLARYRTVTANKRLLVILDGVNFAAQVIPFVPASSGSMVMVTARRHLEGLDTTDGVSLARLDDESARALLERTVGREPVEAEPEATRILLDACEGLPVALRVVGAMLRRGSYRPMSLWARRMSREGGSLDLIDADLGRSLRVVLDRAVAELAPAEALAYRSLGLHPGPTFDAAVVAAATGSDIDAAEDSLDQLVDARLVEPTGSRFRFQSLLHAHARHLAMTAAMSAHDGAPERSEWPELRAIVSHYACAVQTADRALVPLRLRTVTVLPKLATTPVLASPAEASEWFSAERLNIVAVQQLALAQGWDAEVMALGEGAWIACDVDQHHEDALQLSNAAVISADRCRDTKTGARLRGQRGLTLLRLGRPEAAAEDLVAAQAALDSVDDAWLHASMLEWHGVLARELGHFDEALSLFGLAADAFRVLGLRRGEGLQEHLKAGVLLLQGDPHGAAVSAQRAVDLFDSETDGVTAGRALRRLAQALLRCGDQVGLARRSAERAVLLFHRGAAFYQLARAWEVLADVAEAEPSVEAATAHLLKAQSAYSALGSERLAAVSDRLKQLGLPA